MLYVESENLLSPYVDDNDAQRLPKWQIAQSPGIIITIRDYIQYYNIHASLKYHYITGDSSARCQYCNTIARVSDWTINDLQCPWCQQCPTTGLYICRETSPGRSLPTLPPRSPAPGRITDYARTRWQATQRAKLSWSNIEMIYAGYDFWGVTLHSRWVGIPFYWYSNDEICSTTHCQI